MLHLTRAGSAGAAAWELINGPIRAEPHRVGKPLHEPFAGQWVARRSTYRVRYRIDDQARTVVVLHIAGRADAYQSGRPWERLTPHRVSVRWSELAAVTIRSGVVIYVCAGGGGRGIRTHGDGDAASAVFKTAAIGH